jgi:hypothetical protein
LLRFDDLIRGQYGSNRITICDCVLTRARILLKADVSEAGEGWSFLITRRFLFLTYSHLSI